MIHGPSNVKLKFSHLLFTFKPNVQFKSQHLCLSSASQTMTTTICLLQRTPVCTHITCSTHWIMTTADCSVLRYDFMFVQGHKSYLNFRRFLRNEVVSFCLYVNLPNFRKLLRSFTLNLVLQCASSHILFGRIYFVWYMKGDTRWHSWLRHCPISRKAAGSIPDGVIGVFH